MPSKITNAQKLNNKSQNYGFNNKTNKKRKKIFNF